MNGDYVSQDLKDKIVLQCVDENYVDENSIQQREDLNALLFQ